MDTKYINLKFISGNKTLEVGKGKPFRLLNIDGIESGEIVLNTTDNVWGDGTRVRNRRIAFRPIMIECEYTGRNKEEQRRFVAGFFNVHKGGTLQIDYMGAKREIPYEVEGYKSKLENIYTPYRFLVHLYCPEPFLLDIVESSKEIVAWISGISFPLKLPTRFAMAGPRIINVVNNGDIETPVRIEIFGPATNPKITLRETGEFIRIKDTLTADDIVTITTEFGNKRVEKNGQNAFNILDLPDSTFFNLQVGDNVIEFTTEDVSNNANAKISYRNRYLGV